eukprot:scaffold16200_cov153-Isochrysis_galbana.AAC.2
MAHNYIVDYIVVNLQYIVTIYRTIYHTIYLISSEPFPPYPAPPPVPIGGRPAAASPRRHSTDAISGAGGPTPAYRGIYGRLVRTG